MNGKIICINRWLLWGVCFFFCFFSSNGQELPILRGAITRQAQRSIDSLLGRMTIEEQIGQLIMPVIEPRYTPNKVAEYKKLLRDCKAGGLLYRKGDPFDQYRLSRELQTASPISLLISADAEWGLAMRLSNTIRYPRMMALEGLEEQELYNYGRHMAEQCQVMGIHINFSPVLDVNNNPINPVIGTRSFGSDVRSVVRSGLAYAQGLEDGGVLSVAKHFPGHGNTSTDSHKTLPVVSGSLTSLKKTELEPFRRYIESQLGGIMVAHLSVPALEPNRQTPSSLSKKIITDLLQKEMGFSGLVFTDGLEMQGVLGADGIVPISVRAILAGNDVLLGPIAPVQTYKELLKAYQSGVLPTSLIREKCRKILTFKLALCGTLRGVEVSKTPLYTQRNDFLKALHTPSHWDAANSLWLYSVKSIHSQRGVIPFPQGMLGNTSFGVLEVNDKNQGGTAFSDALREVGAKSVQSYSLTRKSSEQEIDRIQKQLAEEAEVIFVNVNKASNTTYAQSLVQRLCRLPRKKVIVTFFTSPFALESWKKSASQASVSLLAYENTSEAKRAAVAKLFGLKTTQLAPLGQMALGQVASLKQKTKKQPREVDNERFIEVANIALNGIKNRAYPGCQIAVIHKGRVVYNKAFGTIDYTPKAPVVSVQTLYDIASVTKILATTPAVMQLIEQGRVNLNDRVEKFLPEFRESEVGLITVKELLLHQSGLVPTINFYLDLLQTTDQDTSLLSYKAYPDWIQIDTNVWGNPNTVYNDLFVHKEKDATFSRMLNESLYITPNFYAQMVKTIINTPLSRNKGYRYSDIGFLLLGRIVEEVTRQPLDKYVEGNIFYPLGLESICYNPLNRSFLMADIAPTQNDLLFRKSLIRGVVEDEMAACMGGVCGNAGLFANALDAAQVAYAFLNKGQGMNGGRIVKGKTVELFLKTKGIGGKRSLGFMNNYKNNSNLPEMASGQTYGHTGFTGTAVWVDPEKELVFVFLSNRTHPTRLNKRLISDGIRPLLLQEVYKAIA